MWLEVKDKIIIGVHSEEIAVKEGSIVYVENAFQDSLGKLYTKSKGVHEAVLTKSELSAIEKDKLIKSSTKFLNDTDYVIMKISEAIILGDDELKNNLMTKYKDILEQRASARLIIG